MVANFKTKGTTHTHAPRISPMVARRRRPDTASSQYLKSWQPPPSLLLSRSSPSLRCCCCCCCYSNVYYTTITRRLSGPRRSVRPWNWGRRPIRNINNVHVHAIPRRKSSGDNGGGVGPAGAKIAACPQRHKYIRTWYHQLSEHCTARRPVRLECAWRHTCTSI